LGAYFDLTAANAALKELYDGQVVENLVYADNPFLAMVPKFTEFGGKYLPVPIITGVSQGRSATFSNALGNQAPVQIQSFLLTRKTDYSIATIDNQTLLASKTDKMAFIEGSKVVIDGAIRAITLNLAAQIFRSGSGSRGQISSITSGVITLVNVADVVQFEVNMTLQANATDGGASPRAALGYVTAVDRQAGTVTVSATALGGSAGTPTGWTANDFLLVQGDNNNTISGLSAWLPTTAPSSTDNFYGVNRSADRIRLAGVYYNGASQSLEEALIDASMLTAREGGKPDHVIMPFASFGALEKSLGAKIQYVGVKGPAEIAFRGIEVNGANTTIKVFPDRSSQVAKGWMLQMNTWRLDSLNEAPHIVRYLDGLEMLRVYNQDAAELRCAYYANLECRAPGWNCNVDFAV